jgi:hypothetical protein
MRRFVGLGLLIGALMLGGTNEAAAQEGHDFLAVGEMAPDFAFTGATRHGVISETLNLSDYRGEVVVLAFFFRARTRG